MGDYFIYLESAGRRCELQRNHKQTRHEDHALHKEGNSKQSESVSVNRSSNLFRFGSSCGTQDWPAER